MTLPDTALVRRYLDKALASAALGKAETSRKLLTYLVERALRGEAPKELEIAIDVFGRDAKFHSAEDSLVRVGVRTLRQKLTEYYADEGRQDDLHFVIPKGGYRLTTEPRSAAPNETSPPDIESAPLAEPAPLLVSTAAASTPRRRGLVWVAVCAVAFLAVSLFANVYWWHRSATVDPAEARVRQSAVWADMYSSSRTLTIVLGDLFMYTQVDPRTGRTITVRDSEINSSEELRQFLASNPSLASERGQRYATLIPKSAAVGMAAILPILARPGRRVEVRILDELQVDDLRNNDVVFIGALARMGPLAGHYLIHSQYRYDARTQGLTDTLTQKAFRPEGALADQRTDYGLAAKFPGPSGNSIMIFASVARNAGLLQIVRTLTSPEGLTALEAKLRDASHGTPAAFEALLVVKGFKRTDLAAELIDVHALAPPRR